MKTLSQDMATLSAYEKIWRLKLSHAKTMTAAFHLHNRQAKRELKVYANASKRIAGSGWGAGVKTLCTAALSLAYSTAEYYAPVWCRSAHTLLVDSVLNDALSIVIGCLRPTPTEHPPVLLSIQPAKPRRLGRHSPWPSVATWTQTIF